MELNEYLRILQKRIWLILALVVLAVLAAVLYLRQQTPLYRTTATLALNPDVPSALLPGAVPQSGDALVSSYVEFMGTQTFANLVVAQLNGAVSTEIVLAALAPRPVRGTQFFRVTATHPDPVIAQAMANTAAALLATSRQNQEEADAQLALERQRLTEMQSLLEEELDSTDGRVSEIESQILTLQQGLRTQETDRQIADLRAEQFSLRSARVEILTRLSDIQTALSRLSPQAAGNSQTAPAEFIDVAPLPVTPLPQNTLRILMAAIVGALALGVTLAWLWDYLDQSMKTPEAVIEAYKMPIQAAIGVINDGSAKERAPLVVFDQPHTSAAEAFRSLRTSIQIADTQKPIRSMLVSSASPGEGKTFVSTNLAASFALAGRHVILVDADLRNPQVHRVFGLPLSPGFSDLIVDVHAPASQYLQQTEIPTLKILTCGTRPSNPAELLSSLRTGEILNQLVQQSHLVIFDTAPVATVTDAQLLAVSVDAAIQVVRAGKTRTDLMRRAKELLEQTQVRLLGPVLNGVELVNLGYYSYAYPVRNPDGSAVKDVKKVKTHRSTQYTNGSHNASRPQTDSTQIDQIKAEG